MLIAANGNPVKCMIIAMLTAIPLLFVWKFAFGEWVYDDAYIAFRFSDNWATGKGLTWNPTEDPVEGFTSFAWVFIGAFIQHFSGIRPHVSMFSVGIVSWIALIVFVVPKMTEVITFPKSETFRGSSTLFCLVTVTVVSLNPYLACQVFNGLETSLHALFFGLVAYFSLRNPTIKNELVLVTACIAFVMVRPDALAFILPLWLIRFIYSERNQKARLIFWFLSFGITLSIYVIVKWQWFGYPLPNTFYIKQGHLLSGLQYVKRYVRVLAPVWLFLVFAAGRAGFSRLFLDKKFMQLLVPTILFLLAYVKVNPVLGLGHRFLIPTLPLIILLCLRAYILSDWNFQSARLEKLVRRSILSDGFIVYLFAMLLVASFFGFQMYKEYPKLQSYFRGIESRLVTAGHHLKDAASLRSAPLLATGDVGAIPYFSKLPTMDIIGLADEVVAHNGLTHEYILERNPDLLILQDLYLLPDPGTQTKEDGNYSDVVISLDGIAYKLDIEKYRKVININSPQHSHCGAGSTFQFVTMPSFEKSYTYIDDIGGYPVFIRDEYAHFEELAGIINKLNCLIKG